MRNEIERLLSRNQPVTVRVVRSEYKGRNTLNGTWVKEIMLENPQDSEDFATVIFNREGNGVTKMTIVVDELSEDGTEYEVVRCKIPAKDPLRPLLRRLLDEVYMYTDEIGVKAGQSYMRLAKVNQDATYNDPEPEEDSDEEEDNIVQMSDIRRNTH